LHGNSDASRATCTNHHLAAAANTATRCKVQIVGAAYTNRGHHNRLRNLYVRDSGACTQLVEQSGQTSHNVIDEINSGAIPVPVH